MKFARLGATGRIGGALVEAAVVRGHSVTAQSRHVGVCIPPGGAAIAADLLDAAALSRIVAGQDAVNYALGFRGRGDIGFFSATARALVEAMAATGVPPLGRAAAAASILDRGVLSVLGRSQRTGWGPQSGGGDR